MPNQIKAELALLHKNQIGAKTKYLWQNDAISRSGSERFHKEIEGKERLFLVKTNKMVKLIYKNKALIYMSKCFH